MYALFIALHSKKSTFKSFFLMKNQFACVVSLSWENERKWRTGMMEKVLQTSILVSGFLYTWFWEELENKKKLALKKPLLVPNGSFILKNGVLNSLGTYSAQHKWVHPL